VAGVAQGHSGSLLRHRLVGRDVVDLTDGDLGRLHRQLDHRAFRYIFRIVVQERHG
jgi:hypothetical protein